MASSTVASDDGEQGEKQNLLEDQVTSLVAQLLEEEKQHAASVAQLLEEKKQHAASVAQLLEEKKQHAASVAQLQEEKMQHAISMASVAQLLQEEKMQHATSVAQLQEEKMQHAASVAQLQDLKKQHAASVAQLQDLKKQLAASVAQLLEEQKQHAELQIFVQERESRWEKKNTQQERRSVAQKRVIDNLMIQMRDFEIERNNNTATRAELLMIRSDNRNLQNEMLKKDNVITELIKKLTCPGCNENYPTVVYCPCHHLVCCSMCASESVKCEVCAANINKKLDVKPLYRERL